MNNLPLAFAVTNGGGPMNNLPFAFAVTNARAPADPRRHDVVGLVVWCTAWWFAGLGLAFALVAAGCR